jgi:hypothetical protein
VESSGRTVTVVGFADTLAPTENVPIATIATLYTDSETGDQFCLVIHKALYLGDAVQSLLNPNQHRANGLKVEDVPRQYEAHSSHSIYIQESKMRIPLMLKGIMSGFESRKPDWDEWERLPRIKLTADTPWAPRSTRFAKQEKEVAAPRWLLLGLWIPLPTMRHHHCLTRSDKWVP